VAALSCDGPLIEAHRLLDGVIQTEDDIASTIRVQREDGHRSVPQRFPGGGHAIHAIAN